MSAHAVVDRVRSLADRLARFPSPRVQRVLVLLVVPALVAGAVVAARNLDLDLAEVRWGALALAGVLGGPVSSTVSAWEFRTSAALAGHAVGLWSALRVTMVATALNYLPGHGGALWRVQHLRTIGAGYRGAASVTLLVALVWLGLAGIAAGALLLSGSAAAVGWAFAAPGAGALLLAAILLRAHHRGAAAAWWAARIGLVEACSIAVAAARLFLVLTALGQRPTLLAPVVLALAGVVASATGILRGGLGLRELLAGAFAPLVGLPVELGFLASALDRLTGTVARVPLALLLFAVVGDRDAAPADARGGRW